MGKGRPSKLTEDKINLIRKRLVQEVSVTEIAVEAQVSVSTVKRYKKSLPPELTQSQIEVGDDVINIDYTTLLTKREEEIAKKIRKSVMQYDDEEEGWVWHLAKADIRRNTSARWWNVIVYPESAPSDWIQRLVAAGYKIAISPLHDKDWWERDSKECLNPETGEILPRGALHKKGDHKKAHWHVILVCDVRMSFKEVNAEVQNICHCPYIQRCKSLSGSYRYFWHDNKPDKYQNYDRSEIQKYNGFQIELTKTDMNKLTQEIIDLIVKNELFEWSEVVEFFNDDLEFLQVLSTKSTFFISYVKSRYYRKNPHSVKHSEVKVVKEFDFENKKDEV